MIYITLGSQKFQFNRLLKEIDRLIEQHFINDEIFAQIGFSDYKPSHYLYKDFLDMNEYSDIMSKSNIVITHGGTGTIINAVKLGKKVIAVPRLSKYGEHVDNHQLQIVKLFNEINMILGIMDVDLLELALSKCATFEPINYVSNTSMIIDSIDEFIINIKK